MEALKKSYAVDQLIERAHSCVDGMLLGAFMYGAEAGRYSWWWSAVFSVLIGARYALAYKNAKKRYEQIYTKGRLSQFDY